MPSPGKPTSIRIDPVLYGGLQVLVREKQQRLRGTTIRGKLEEAIRRHLAAEQSELASPTLAPAIEAVVDERLTRLEHRLSGLLAKTGLDAATCLYVLLHTRRNGYSGPISTYCRWGCQVAVAPSQL